jgi:hypothetical protein
MPTTLEPIVEKMAMLPKEISDFLQGDHFSDDIDTICAGWKINNTALFRQNILSLLLGITTTDAFIEAIMVDEDLDRESAESLYDDLSPMVFQEYLDFVDAYALKNKIPVQIATNTPEEITLEQAPFEQGEPTKGMPSRGSVLGDVENPLRMVDAKLGTKNTAPQPGVPILPGAKPYTGTDPYREPPTV